MLGRWRRHTTAAGGIARRVQPAKKAGEGRIVKTQQELKTEATALRDQLQSVIDLNALRQFWKDLEDHFKTGGGRQPSLFTVVDFDEEIIVANVAKRLLHARLSDLINQL
jgi:hypothetical protein